MAGEMMKRGTAAVMVKGGGALKKAPKKVPGKKAAGKKAAKKVPGKKAAGKKAAKKVPGKKATGEKAAGKKAAGKKAAKKTPGKKGAKRAAGRVGISGFHHLQRAAAMISLLEGESGGDLRMLLEEGVRRYRDEAAGADGLLRAAEHLAMAGLYVARVSHRLDVEAPDGVELGRMLDRVGVRVDGLSDSRLAGMAGELLRRAEGAEDDVHLAWELGMAADGICEAAEEE